MPTAGLRTVPELHDVGPRYDAAEGRSSVLVAPPEPDPPAASAKRLSLAEGWRLLRTPASEQGIIQYYRVLLDRPPEPEATLAILKGLRLGQVMRLDVLLNVAYSGEAQARGLSGPGRKLIRIFAALARHSRLAGFVRLKRRLAIVSALAERSEASDPGSPLLSAEIARLRQEVGQLRTSEPEQSADPRSAEDVLEIKDRLQAIEAALLELLNARAQTLARGGAKWA